MIPWRQWFAFAVCSLGLSPDDFWSLTLFEWRSLAPDGGGAMDRSGLEKLIALYPDKRPGTGNRQSGIGI